MVLMQSFCPGSLPVFAQAGLKHISRDSMTERSPGLALLQVTTKNKTKRWDGKSPDRAKTCPHDFVSCLTSRV